MALDPTKHADWEIAEDSDTKMKTAYQLAEELGLEREELLPHGYNIAKIDFYKVLKRIGDKSDGKFIDVTAIPTTPLGNGESTTTMGLVQGLGKRGKNVVGAIRQPSGGPTMSIKGSAAGGGLSQCISLVLSDDINAIMNAQYLSIEQNF